MKRLPCLVLAVLLFSGLAFAQVEFHDKKFEISVLGGMGLTRFEGSSVYSNDWSWRWLNVQFEQTTVDLASKNGLSFAGGFAYYFTPNLGVQIGGGFFGPKADITSTWTMRYNWTIGSSTAFSSNGDFPDTSGMLTSIPIFLNLVGKYSIGMIELFGTAGPTLYMNKVDADAYTILVGTYFYGVWPSWGSQWVDGFQIPLKIAESWSGFGFNAGAGLNIRFAPTVAFVLEARYFFCPEKSLSWEWIEGTYTGIIYEPLYHAGVFVNWDFSEEYLVEWAPLMTALKANASRFFFGAGFKIFF